MKLRQKELHRSTSGLLILALVVPMSAFAADSGSSACSNTQGSMQKQQYCDAAKTAREAAKADRSSMMVWSGVTAVCTAQCATSFMTTGTDWAGGKKGGYVCMGASVAGGLADAVLTKNMAGAMMGLAPAGAAYMLSKDRKVPAEETAKANTPNTDRPIGVAESDTSMGPSASEGQAQSSASSQSGTGQQAAQKSAERDGDWGSCLLAATSAMQVFMKKMNADSNEQTAKENERLAAQLAEATANLPTVSTDASGLTAAAMSGSSTASGTTGSGTTIGSGSSAGTACSSVGSSAASTVACALASDKNLPPFVATQKFADEIKKNSGMDLKDFFDKAGQNPNAAIASASGMGPEAAGKLSAILAAAESRMSQEQGAAYAGGGGGGGGGGSEGPDMNAMLAGIMGQLNPKQEEEAKKNANLMQFNGRKLASASAEDPTVSIFDRVAYRYSVIKPRMLSVERLADFNAKK